jgi:tetratricopeptide (TPR) repeat protein
MDPRHISLRIGLAACLFIPFSSQIVLPQQKPSEKRILADFEKSIQLGTGDEIDRRLLDFAVANPNNSKALELLARLRLRQGRLTESKALYQRVLTLDPTSINARINSGRIAYALGQRDEARQFLAGIKEASLTPTLQLELAAAMFLIGETQDALKLAEGLPVNLRNTTGLPLLAAIYLESGRRDELTGLIPLMKKASLTNSALATQCANILYKAGLYKQGIALLRPFSAGIQKNAEILVALGRLEVLDRDFTHAREHLKQATTLEPNSAGVLSAQAFLESESGNASEALKLLTNAREVAPNSKAVLADLVVLALRSGQPVLAVDAAKALIAMEPENPEFEYLFGTASLQGGDLDAARNALEEFLQKRPRDSRGCLALGMTFAAQRDKIEDARRQLRHCVEIDPSGFEAQYQLGLSYKSQGDNKQAILMLEEVVKKAPNYSSALRDLGALHLENGDDAKARDLLERAVSLSPQDADIHFQLIRLYNRIGESALAKQHIEIFQKLRGPWGKSAQ